MFNPDIHHRRSIRIPEYDYSNEGYYFVTICTQNRKCILSKISTDIFKNCRGEVPPSPINTKIGNEVENTIEFISNKYNNIEINTYKIMPNHVHLIVEILGRDGTLPLHKIISEIKTYTTKRYNEIFKTKNKKLWQRNYYEHVIRNEKEYLEIYEYIEFNPLNWEKDINYMEV